MRENPYKNMSTRDLLDLAAKLDWDKKGGSTYAIPQHAYKVDDPDYAPDREKYLLLQEIVKRRTNGGKPLTQDSEGSSRWGCPIFIALDRSLIEAIEKAQREQDHGEDRRRSR